MTITRKQAWLFVAAMVWTVYVWVTRISVIARDDHPAGFVIVHGGLAVVSIAFALVIGRIGIRALRIPASHPDRARPSAARSDQS